MTRTYFFPLAGVALVVAAGGIMAAAWLHEQSRSGSGTNTHASSPPIVRAKAGRGAKTPYDLPAEAMAFFIEQRTPDGARTLDATLYEAARRDARRLDVHSAKTGRVTAARTAGALRNELSDWQPLGPGNIGGRTRVLRFHPRNPDIMYAAGVAGGVWRSTDAGTTWTPIGDLAGNLAVTSLVIDDEHPERIWAGTGEGYFNIDAVRGAGIFISEDGGGQWRPLPATGTADFHYVNDLVQSPHAPNTLYAATRAGILRTLDAGITWDRVVDAGPDGLDVSGGCLDLVIRTDVAGRDAILASCGTFGSNATNTALKNGVVLRNADAAGTSAWEPVLSIGTAGTMGRTALAIAPSNQDVAYALVAAGGGSAHEDGLLGVWRSADGGLTWTAKLLNSGGSRNRDLLLSNPIIARLEECFSEPPGSNALLDQGWYDNVIAVDPADPDRVWAGGIDLWRSDNQGADWGIASSWWQDRHHYVHADQHGLFFHPRYDGASNRQLFVTNDGGIYRTDDASAAVGTNESPGPDNSLCAQSPAAPATAWTGLNNGYAVTQFYHGAVYPDGMRYFGGTQDNGTVRGSAASGPNGWQEIYGGDGGYVAVDPRDSKVLYLETTDISIRKSLDGGASFADADQGIQDSGLFINPFTLDQNAPDRLWTSGRTLWRSDNGAATWTRASGELTQAAPFDGGHRFSAHAVAPALSDLVLAGTNRGQILRSEQATSATAATLWQVASAAGGRLRSGTVAMIAFDPVQNSSNPGARTAIAVFSNFNAPQTEPAGLETPHVWRSDDGGRTWRGIDGEGDGALPNVPVHSIAIDPSTRGAKRLFVGTDIGVFVTIDGGRSWLRENAGGANTVVEWLQIRPGSTTGEYELFAFTHGRGAYRTTFAPGDHIFASGMD